MGDDYPPLSSVATGLRSACPRCGEGKLYKGILEVADRCSVCGLDYSDFNADDGAAFFIIVGFSALIIPLALWFQFSAEPPIWAHLIWVPVIVGGAILLLRIVKAWLMAQQFKHGVTDADTTR
ncbi:MAG: DUF983 domain-containing protein [Alphaproteobacteria bacterium]